MSNTYDSYVPDLAAYIKYEMPESHVKPFGLNTYYSSSSPETHSSDGDYQKSYDNFPCAYSQESMERSMCLKEPSNESEFPSPETILFFEILQEFPDLLTFIGHPSSMIFCYLWLELQQAIFNARKPENRPQVQSWLKSAALRIHCLLVSIVKSNPGNNDMTSEPRCMFSAFRRLKDRIEVMHQIFQLIENGRIWFNQTPAQAIEPFIDAALQIKRDVSYFSNHSDIIPVIGGTDGHVDLVSPDKVSLEDLSSRVISTYNIMPYEQPEEEQESLPLQTGHPPDSTQTIRPNNALLPYIQPSFVHPSWSLPVTPSCVEQLKHYPFTSLPTSPTCTEVQNLSGLYTDLSFSSEAYQEPSPIHTVDDYLMDKPIQDCAANKPSRADDDEYIASETEEEEETLKKKKKSRQNGANHKNTSRLSISGQQHTAPRTRKERTGKGTERKYTRRTATSYDAQTTHYLKTVFFSIYSSRDKLTKEQRRQVQKETGLKPRNITYWFSNHKRRFQASLAIFKRVVDQSEGKVKTYDDFLAWRRNHQLPEEVSEEELNGVYE